MSIEEQIRTIARSELENQFAELEKLLKNYYKDENSKLRLQVDDLTRMLEDVKASNEDLVSRIEKLEEDLGNRFGLIVKLRKYTLDQLMSEYKRLTGNMRPEKKEIDENTEIWLAFRVLRALSL